MKNKLRDITLEEFQKFHIVHPFKIKWCNRIAAMYFQAATPKEGRQRLVNPDTTLEKLFTEKTFAGMDIFEYMERLQKGETEEESYNKRGFFMARNRHSGERYILYKRVKAKNPRHTLETMLGRSLPDKYFLQTGGKQNPDLFNKILETATTRHRFQSGRHVKGLGIVRLDKYLDTYERDLITPHMMQDEVIPLLLSRPLAELEDNGLEFYTPSGHGSAQSKRLEFGEYYLQYRNDDFYKVRDYLYKLTGKYFSKQLLDREEFNRPYDYIHSTDGRGGSYTHVMRIRIP